MTLSESGTLVGMSVGILGLVITAVSWAVRTHMEVKRHDAKLAGLAQRQDELDGKFDALTQEVKVSSEAINDLEATVGLLTQSISNHQNALEKRFSAHQEYLDKRFDDLHGAIKDNRTAVEKQRELCMSVLAGNHGRVDEAGRMGAGEQIGKARKG